MIDRQHDTGNKHPRMLIRGTNWIGDSVMSLPALRELRRLYPEHHLTLLVKDWVAGIFEGQGIVDEILLLDSSLSHWKRLRTVPGRLKGYQSALLLQNAFEAALMVFLARIPDRVGYNTDHRGILLTRQSPPRTPMLARHQVYYYLDLLYLTGLSPLNYLHSDFKPDIRLRPTGEGMEKAGKLLSCCGVDPQRPLVGLNPGAFFGSAKRWFTDRYARLADLLIESENAQVVVFGSSGERRIAEEIQKNMKQEPIILAGRTDLVTLLALISSCRLFITNDSGPMHLAAALDVPLLALFGSTDEAATGPFHPGARIIHKHVECSPCLLRECPIDLRCFSRIEVEEVYQAAREMLWR